MTKQEVHHYFPRTPSDLMMISQQDNTISQCFQSCDVKTPEKVYSGLCTKTIYENIAAIAERK